MAKDPFPASALAANRARRLTPEQVAGLHRDARESRKSGLLAGLALFALGGFVLWGTVAGRIPGSRFKSFAVGAALAGVGALLLGSRGMSRGPRAAQAVSESTVLDVVEGPLRRERIDQQLASDLFGNTRNLRGDARYDWLLHIGDRRLRVGRPEYEAAPEDGVVRAWLLPDSDRIVNLERIANAPPTPVEVRATEFLRERFGAVPATERPLKSAGSAASLREALIGRWQAQGMPLRLEFRADGTVASDAEGAGETKRWEVLDAARIRVDGEEQRVEVDGDELLLATMGPTFRFHRVPG